MKQVEGCIGYCELAYALYNDTPQAFTRNAKGNFISPSTASISQAANAEIFSHTRVSLANTPAEHGYPLSSFTWIIGHNEQNYNNRSKAKAETLLKLL